ncbi:MAG: L-serine ammonia-lyase [Pseudomonadota bacterium]
MLSFVDIFKIGIGPSSSHTVGPMRIAARFVEEAIAEGAVCSGAHIEIDLHGSLAFTGLGHGTLRAVHLGLLGHVPDTIDMGAAERDLAALHESKSVTLPSGQSLGYDPETSLHLKTEVIPKLHPNEMVLRLVDHDKNTIYESVFYSVGGGFIASAKQLEAPAENDLILGAATGPFPFTSAEELLALCREHNLTIHEIVLGNEDALRPRAETETHLANIWRAMDGCIERGLATEGLLPGHLKVRRRAAELYRKLIATMGENEPERLFDWLNVYAIAVNEENAAGGQVVTAPTNGAAGIIPAVLKHYAASDGPPRLNQIFTFLLTAAGIGILYKQRASISGAEMGCQGEVGVACSMAAGGLTAIWGGTPDQVEHAAEIGMEHNLGLTCDPVGGLVQIPCIERNAIGAVKAVNAARLALRAGDEHKVSLDQVIETMRQTGLDMSTKYKETSEGGLAINVVEC